MITAEGVVAFVLDAVDRAGKAAPALSGRGGNLSALVGMLNQGGKTDTPKPAPASGSAPRPLGTPARRHVPRRAGPGHMAKAAAGLFPVAASVVAGAGQPMRIRPAVALAASWAESPVQVAV